MKMLSSKVLIKDAPPHFLVWAILLGENQICHKKKPVRQRCLGFFLEQLLDVHQNGTP